MATDFFMKQHDTAPAIQSTLTDATGAPVDITGASVKAIMNATTGGTPKFASSATIVTPAAGLVQYSWATGDCDTAGTFNFEWEVTFASGKIETFPDPGYLTILVTADLETA